MEFSPAARSVSLFREVEVSAALHIYFRYVANSFHGQMQYRASFVMMSGGNFLYAATKFLALWIIFGRFGNIVGWSLHEVALLYGMVQVALAAADITTPGFRTFGELVRRGELDRLLLRPHSTALQLAAYRLDLSYIGSLLQGLAVLLWAILNLSISWTLSKLFILSLGILGGTFTFYGLYIIEATLSFWTTQSLEFMNSFTRGGAAAAQYPFKIYQVWFRRFFTFIVPVAFASYYPAMFILDRSDHLLHHTALIYCSPIVGFVFFTLCLQFWTFGVKHYCSTGS